MRRNPRNWLISSTYELTSHFRLFVTKLTEPFVHVLRDGEVVCDHTIPREGGNRREEMRHVPGKDDKQFSPTVEFVTQGWVVRILSPGVSLTLLSFQSIMSLQLDCTVHDLLPIINSDVLKYRWPIRCKTSFKFFLYKTYVFYPTLFIIGFYGTVRFLKSRNIECIFLILLFKVKKIYLTTYLRSKP